jgi:hypothetical protein
MAGWSILRAPRTWKQHVNSRVRIEDIECLYTGSESELGKEARARAVRRNDSTYGRVNFVHAETGI